MTGGTRTRRSNASSMKTFCPPAPHHDDDASARSEVSNGLDQLLDPWRAERGALYRDAVLVVAQPSAAQRSDLRGDRHSHRNAARRVRSHVAAILPVGFPPLADRS